MGEITDGKAVLDAVTANIFKEANDLLWRNQDRDVLQSTLCSYPNKLLFPTNHIENNHRCGIHFSNHRLEGNTLPSFQL